MHRVDGLGLQCLKELFRIIVGPVPVRGRFFRTLCPTRAGRPRGWLISVSIRERFTEFIERFASKWPVIWSGIKSAPEMAYHLKRGKTGEQLAYHCLRKNGYRIVARNYRKYYGEIDLIGWESGSLVFVEVKLRQNANHGLPQDAVNLAKRRQISRVAKEYRKRHHLHDINYRFDIVSIQGNPGKERIEILKDAFKDPLPA